MSSVKSLQGTSICQWCGCTACRSTEEAGLGVTRAFIHHLAAKETVGAHLLTIHNVYHMLALMKSIRTAIIEERYPAFVKDFFFRYFPQKGAPEWAVDALRSVV